MNEDHGHLSMPLLTGSEQRSVPIEILQVLVCSMLCVWVHHIVHHTLHNVSACVSSVPHTGTIYRLNVCVCMCVCVYNVCTVPGAKVGHS